MTRRPRPKRAPKAWQQDRPDPDVQPDLDLDLVNDSDGSLRAEKAPSLEELDRAPDDSSSPPPRRWRKA